MIGGIQRMKYIFANLKRFDIPKEMDGINGLAPVNKVQRINGR